MLELDQVRVDFPEDANVIIGHAHFIKTVEDLYEAVVTTVPGAQFGVAFNEASGPCLVRFDGNDDELKQCAVKNAKAIGAGHLFVIVLRKAYPINLLPRLRHVAEICTIFCATANPVEVIVARTEQGRGVLGVVDGNSPMHTETPADVEERNEFLRKIGYKR